MPPILTSLYEAKTNLSKLVERAAAGEEIIIAKNGVPKAKLVPLSKANKSRRIGGWEGKVWIAENFDDPLPDDIQAAFERRGDEPSS
ncbi:MAG: type II toxin-antitoxin system Phd/YefM family antitoxin [Proteobacteria bacterium]|nr:type II toxin-antitoxin system Phd/YefM family antitoxin [Pseudomonadota bacterium]